MDLTSGSTNFFFFLGCENPIHHIGIMSHHIGLFRTLARPFLPIYNDRPAGGHTYSCGTVALLKLHAVGIQDERGVTASARMLVYIYICISISIYICIQVCIYIYIYVYIDI